MCPLLIDICGCKSYQILPIFNENPADASWGAAEVVALRQKTTEGSTAMALGCLLDAQKLSRIHKKLAAYAQQQI